MADAKLVASTNEELVAELGLQDLLGSYLKALQLGGHHVLYFPPRFEEADLFYTPRLSLASEFAELGQEFGASLATDIEGFSEARINAQLSLTWGVCMFAARERRSPLKWDSASCLAEYQTWLFEDFRGEIDWHSSMKFREPRVTILCGREMVLLFTLSEVRFYAIGEPWTEPPEEKCVHRSSHPFVALRHLHLFDIQAGKG